MAASAAWQGDESALNQLCQMFAAASSPDTQVQQQVMQMLGQFSTLPDFNMYLITVFAKMPQQQEVVRQRAGLLLKTNVSRLQAGSLAPGMLEQIQEHALVAMQDSSRTIRNTAGTILTTIVQMEGLVKCNATVEKLVQGLSSHSMELVEGCLGALSKICEDGVVLLMQFTNFQSEHTQHFVNWCTQRLLPKVFECAAPASPVFARQTAVECLNHFALAGAFNDDKFPAFKQFSPKYIETLGVLANDQVVEVKRAVCKGFACTIENSWSCLTNHHYEVILGFMLKQSQHPEYSVRLEALAVWEPCANMPESWSTVHPLLPELVPTLLKNMIYSDADYMCMEQSQLEDDNAACPDSLDEIKPRFHQKRDDEKDEDEEDVKRSTSWGTEWTVRKAAASSLDSLANMFHAEILKLVLGQVEANLQDPSWERQESGVLALGAIAPGCMDSLAQFLPKVMELLLGLCATPKPLLRSISCWCISRFSPWICHEQNPNSEQVLASVVRALLQRCLDRNKRVQEAACSAVAVLTETALLRLVPYLNDIVQTFVKAFQLYQTKNMRILYDAIGTLAWAVGAELDKREYVEALFVPIMHRFDTVADNDVTTVSLFECISYLLQTLGKSIVPIIPRFITRCTRVVREVAQAAKLWEQNPNEYERPDRELMATAVDLLAGILEGLGPAAAPIIAQQNFLAILPDALGDNAMRVKQSGFALIGCCATNCCECLSPMLPQLLPQCALGMAPTNSIPVSNNASWAVGEICVRTGSDFMTPYLETLVPALATVLYRDLPTRGKQQYSQHQLKQNVCITIGRLGTVCGDKMGKMLHTFLEPWCIIMRIAPLDVEKIKAFQGICTIIKSNWPAEAGLRCFPHLAAAMVSIYPAPPPLAAIFREILEGYKGVIGGNWPALFQAFPEDVRNRLQQMYQLG
eukprot:gnl/TRDRNA2_/TRDRNA2_85671_c0_seq1.p1 gnl/TRDRNA2_/TRDRNA2_85671_c0~~gnl/TRDRNA2_/TRDRNA2_85671_c0_seq1.p1  ORF type:complete len:943 (-),score=149.44 gnl/TRDRNA2_/TRDRNA2_85671_c0_seq1:223-2982(-)